MTSPRDVVNCVPNYYDSIAAAATAVQFSAT